MHGAEFFLQFCIIINYWTNVQNEHNKLCNITGLSKTNNKSLKRSNQFNEEIYSGLLLAE